MKLTSALLFTTLLPLSVGMANAKSPSDKQEHQTLKKIEKILTCDTNSMPDILVPLIYKVNGHSTFNRRDSYIGEYTLLPDTLFLYNQPIEAIYVTKFMGEQNKDYYQYTTILPETANISILAKSAGLNYDGWDGKYVRKGNNRVGIFELVVAHVQFKSSDFRFTQKCIQKQFNAILSYFKKRIENRLKKIDKISLSVYLRFLIAKS